MQQLSIKTSEISSAPEILRGLKIKLSTTPRKQFVQIIIHRIHVDLGPEVLLSEIILKIRWNIQA